MSSDDTIVNRAEEGEEMEHSPPSPQDWSPSPERGFMVEEGSQEMMAWEEAC